MYLLVINVGSSSVKYALFECSSDDLRTIETVVSGPEISEIPQTIQSLLATHSITMKDIICIIRVVHGGWKLQEPSFVTAEVLEYLQSISTLAPLHNPKALETIRLLQQTFADIRLIAAFDTQFHCTMPSTATQYALPINFAEQNHIKRYGFHGFAHASMLRQYATQLQIPIQQSTIITIQLGSGCSICAMKDGISIDTSMGFSPLEGLISRTRTGSIDAQIVSYLQDTQGMTLDEIFQLFNHESGLKGLSGTEGHIQQLDHSNSQHAFALELFIYRIQQYIGAYDAIIGGAKAIVFGGGISEHAPWLIQKVFTQPFFRVSIDTARQYNETFMRMTTDSSERHVYIAQVNEEYEMARSSLSIIQQLKI